MKLRTLDSETFLIRPGMLIPRVVCVQLGALDNPPPMTASEPVDPEDPFLGVVVDWKPTFDAVRATVALPEDPDGIPAFRRLLLDRDVRIVGQNIAFDMAALANRDLRLLPLIYEAYEDNRIEDIKLREKLILIAMGRLADEGESGAKLQEKFDLASIAARHFGVDLSADKTNPTSWRLRYRELDGIPVAQWPEEARRYALDDDRWNLTIWANQARIAGGEVPDSFAQARAAFWMHLMGAWGIRTDRVAVEKIEHEQRERLASMDRILREAGVLKAKMVKDLSSPVGRSEKWSMNKNALREYIAEAYGGAENVKHTAGRVSKELGVRVPEMATDRDTLVQGYEPGDHVLETYDKLLQEMIPADAQGKRRLPTREEDEVARQKAADQHSVIKRGVDVWLVLRAAGERSGVEKILGTFIPTLYEGTTRPITPNWNSLVASGRISCINPNLTFQPRKGGVRECYVPRRGMLFCVADYSFIELVTLAQTCLDWYGESKLAEVINAGGDPHIGMAAELLNISYEEAEARYAAGDPLIAEMRQVSKALNFGFPGGLGAKKMVAYAYKSYGVRMSEDEARQRKEAWYRRDPVMRRYHADMGQFQEQAPGGLFKLVQPGGSGRVRGGLTFTSGSNTGFQGRTADGAKRAGWYVSRECYLEQPYATVEKHLAMGLEIDADGRMLPSPLYGCRIVCFVHDEFIVEAPRARASAACKRLVEVMKAGMREYVKDVRVGVEGVLVARWYKGAKPVHDENGNLIPWVPKPKEKKAA